MISDAELEIIGDECRRLQDEVRELQKKFDDEHEELERVQAQLKEKSDLCTMYEHMLEEKRIQLESMGRKLDRESEENDRYFEKIKQMTAAVDVLACRITELKKW